MGVSMVASLVRESKVRTRVVRNLAHELSVKLFR